ncbi:MAG: pyridoxal-phosphate dependent enzyme, partial [Chloroflexi bacterium]
TVIGQEAIEQMALAGEYPDVIVAPIGGGSNFAGITLPFLRANLREGKKTRLVGVEPAACPSLTKGQYTYDFGDTVGMTPMVKMYTLGHTFVPPPLHAGGLRYHGMASIVCEMYDQGLMEAVAIPQLETFKAAITFARAEGIVPAPEAAHGIAGAIREALAAKEAGEKRVIVFNLCGHGHFDMSAYDAYLGEALEDYEYPQEEVNAALAQLPQV